MKKKLQPRITAVASPRGEGVEPSLLGVRAPCLECARPRGSKKKQIESVLPSLPIIKNCAGPDERKLHPLCHRDLVISLGLPTVPGSKSRISMKRERKLRELA